MSEKKDLIHQRKMVLRVIVLIMDMVAALF